MGSEIVGMGSEKFVKDDISNPERVVAELKFNYNENQAKGAYYLAKIAHLLFPKNIPDIHLAATDKRIFDKKEHDEVHSYIQEIYQGKRKLDGKEAEKLLAIINERNSHPAIVKLKADMSAAGFRFDEGIQNYSIEDDGTAVHLDSEVPWTIENKEIISFYDRDKILFALSQLPESQRIEGLKYLERLDALFEQYKQHLKNNHVN